MAIPQGRMSSTVVPGNYLVPADRAFYALSSYEMGPIAIENISAGLLNQVWTVDWNPNTHVLTATPEDSGLPITTLTIMDLVSLTFTFDQSGRISFTWTTTVSSFMYWYDTAIPGTVTTDLGAGVITPALTLDDKRRMQSGASDMLLWYTREDGGGTYDLYMALQRERFLTDYLMMSGLEYGFIHNIGMTDQLRLQLTVKNSPPPLIYIP
jgi:hypothetical protein